VTLELHAISGEMVGKVDLSTVCPNVRGTGRPGDRDIGPGLETLSLIIIIFPF
jgi:hypothetical protein